MSEERLSATAIDAAIAWTVKLDYSEPTPETRRAFERWLQADAEHELAWQRAHALKGLVERVPPRLLRDTLQTVDEQRRTRGLSRRRALKLLSFAGIGFAAAWLAGPNLLRQRQAEEYASTRIGERRTLQLADGTVLILNTDSAVLTRFGADERRIVLQRGEILLTTGKDTGAVQPRPLRVYTPFGTVQAIGTRFVVRIEDQRARISVQEGAVALRAAAGGEPAVVYAGESRWLGAHGSEPAVARGFEDDAWADGVIVARNLRLADLVAELARYRVGAVDCDERIADLPVSGVFHLTDPDQTLRFLAQTQSLSVVRNGAHIGIGPKILD